MPNLSPGNNLQLVTRTPFTNVPWREPRSSTQTAPSINSRRQWRLLSHRSSMRTLTSRPRPTSHGNRSSRISRGKARGSWETSFTFTAAKKAEAAQQGGRWRRESPMGDRGHPKTRWGAVNGFAPRMSQKLGNPQYRSDRPATKRTNVGLCGLLLRWIVRPKGLRFPPAAIGALVLPRIDNQVAAVEMVVAAVDCLGLTLRTRTGHAKRLRHGYSVSGPLGPSMGRSSSTKSRTSLNWRYTLAKRTKATWSSWASRFITRSPTFVVSISDSVVE